MRPIKHTTFIFF